LLPADLLVISGHIHTHQSINYRPERGYQIIYPGTPRQLTRSDIGMEKGVVLWSVRGGQFQLIPTPEDVCERFKQITITSSDQVVEIQNSIRTYVDVYGSKDDIKKICKNLPPLVKYRTFPEKNVTATTIKESDGIPKAFLNYVLDYANQKQLNNAEVKQILETIFNQCPVLQQSNE
jgi:DNA repair exonuclease SbcCD nuclease subunit